MAKQRALITGYTGQDGSYLAELLLDHGYEVFGVVRRQSFKHMPRVNHLVGRVKVLEGDVSDPHSMRCCVAKAQPHEVYNLAAMSFVGASWEQPALSMQVTGMGAVHCLEAIRAERLHECKFYQAGSSEMFGNSLAPQSEDTLFAPTSPYACAKLYAHHMVQTYRDSYGMFAVSGILFNHESPRRGIEFVTQKIATQAAEIAAGKRTQLALGNIDAQRDWGHAADYVQAMYLMLQQNTPNDYVVGTGVCHTVRAFAETAFAKLGMNWKQYVVISDKYKRPADVRQLRSDPSRIKSELGWQPTTTFDDLVEDMVDAAQQRVTQNG